MAKYRGDHWFQHVSVLYAQRVGPVFGVIDEFGVLYHLAEDQPQFVACYRDRYLTVRGRGNVR